MGTGGDIQHLFFIKSEERTNISENKNTVSKTFRDSVLSRAILKKPKMTS